MCSHISQPISHWCRNTIFWDRTRSSGNCLGNWEAPSPPLWKWFQIAHDCKPVQLIFSNPKSRSPPHIERWNLCLQGYDFKVVHTEGSQNPSDFLSRHSNSNDERNKAPWQRSMSTSYLASAAAPKAMNDPCWKSRNDSTRCHSAVFSQPHTATVMEKSWKPFATISRSWSNGIEPVQTSQRVNDGTNIILSNSRIRSCTCSLHDRANSIAHEGH